MESYYLPEWEIQKVSRAVRLLAGQSAFFHGGYLPLSVTVASPLDEEQVTFSFALMKDEEGRYYYESVYPVETNGVKHYLKIHM